MLGLSVVTWTSIVQSLTARDLPLAVEGYMVYFIPPLPHKVFLPHGHRLSLSQHLQPPARLPPMSLLLYTTGCPSLSALSYPSARSPARFSWAAFLLPPVATVGPSLFHPPPPLITLFPCVYFGDRAQRHPLIHRPLSVSKFPSLMEVIIYLLASRKWGLFQGGNIYD